MLFCNIGVDVSSNQSQDDKTARWQVW